MKENILLEELKKDFKNRSKKDGEGALLKRELECYEYIFSNEDDTSSCRQGASVRIIPGFREKFFEYSGDFSDFEISKIRKAYCYFIKYKTYRITEPYIFYHDIFQDSNLSPEELEEKAISLGNTVKVYYDFLQWLRCFKGEKYPDKFYAWYHKIRIAIGKAAQFTSGARQEIIDYGKNEYNTKGHGFYQAFNDFDLTKHSEYQKFVDSLTPKDRKKWKGIIIKISNDDSDVINFLKKFPS